MNVYDFEPLPCAMVRLPFDGDEAEHDGLLGIKCKRLWLRSQSAGILIDLSHETYGIIRV